LNPDAPKKLPTPFFTKDSLIAAVSRDRLPLPAYLAPIVQKYHDLAAEYSDAEGNHPEYLEHHFGGENHLILLHFPVTGLDLMMKASKEGTLFNATMNYLLYLLGPTFLNGLVCDVYPFCAPPDCKGKKWFESTFGHEFVNQCEAISLEFILAVSRQSSITKFVSMGTNPHRLMKIARSQFPSTHIVSSSCCHPHRAIQWGIDLDIARSLDEMASMLTGLTIRSQENHYNNHRDEFDAIAAARELGRKLHAFGGPKMSQLQEDKSYGGPKMSQLQEDKRYGGPKMTQLQEDKRFGGPDESYNQKVGKKKAADTINAKNNLGKDCAWFKCTGCECIKQRPLQSRPRHEKSVKIEGKKCKKPCGQFIKL
jgi:hypothetical protein